MASQDLANCHSYLQVSALLILELKCAFNMFRDCFPWSFFIFIYDSRSSMTLKDNIKTPKMWTARGAYWHFDAMKCKDVWCEVTEFIKIIWSHTYQIQLDMKVQDQLRLSGTSPISIPILRDAESIVKTWMQDFSEICQHCLTDS